MQLHRHQPAFAAAGASLAVIGNGAPTYLSDFRRTTGYDGPLYTDPSLVIYQVLRLRRGLGSVLRPSVAAHAVRAVRGGFRQGATQGHALQQGGVAVVDERGAIRYRYASRAAGDHPAVADVLAAVAALAPAR
ncbi:MAG: peroxiredoxin-like family protein [Kofleriaceae bacterium]